AVLLPPAEGFHLEPDQRALADAAALDRQVRELVGKDPAVLGAIVGDDAVDALWVRMDRGRRGDGVVWSLHHSSLKGLDVGPSSRGSWQQSDRSAVSSYPP